jgi:hypothetical protein
MKAMTRGITRTMAAAVVVLYPQSKTSDCNAQDTLRILKGNDFPGSGGVEGQKVPEAGSWTLNVYEVHGRGQAARAREQCAFALQECV